MKGGSESDPETFPLAYVEQLRQENGKYRQRAQQADTYAERLHTELVRATGRLADPTDLPYIEDHLVDADKMADAITELLNRKPHLAARRASGDIGQGHNPSREPWTSPRYCGVPANTLGGYSVGVGPGGRPYSVLAAMGSPPNSGSRLKRDPLPRKDTP